MDNSLYSLEAKTISNTLFAFSELKGKVVLIVNTASKCGFTPQYVGLEELYQKYKDQGLVILGFPCNQFGGQEPDSEASIAENCSINFGVTFPLFSKVDVNGPETHPVYTFLKKEKGSILGRKIKWNFTKFLITREGKVVKRIGPMVTPETIEPKIKKLLQL